MGTAGTRPSGESISVELLEPQTLESLREEWETLFASSGCDNPFLTFEWATVSCRHVAKGVEPIVAAARDDQGRLIGVAGLEVAPLRPWGRELRFLGSPYNDYAGFLARPQQIDTVTHALMGAVLERGGFDRVRLYGFRRDLDGHEAAAAVLAKAGRVEDEVAFECPAAVVEGSYEDYLCGRSSKMRANMRNRLGRLERDRDLVFWRTGSLDRDHLARIFEIHLGRDEERQGTSVFARSRGRDFFADLSSILGEAGLLDVAGMDVDGKLVAYCYGMRLRETYFYWIASFDREYGRFGPGVLLIDYLLRTGCDEGLRKLDFMVGTEPYKDQWATQRYPDFQVTCLLSGHRLLHGLQNGYERGHDFLRSVKDRNRLLQALWMRILRRR